MAKSAAAIPIVTINLCEAHHQGVASEGLKTSECIACIREERDRLRELVAFMSGELENLVAVWRIKRKELK